MTQPHDQHSHALTSGNKSNPAPTTTNDGVSAPKPFALPPQQYPHQQLLQPVKMQHRSSSSTLANHAPASGTASNPMASSASAYCSNYQINTSIGYATPTSANPHSIVSPSLTPPLTALKKATDKETPNHDAVRDTNGSAAPNRFLGCERGSHYVTSATEEASGHHHDGYNDGSTVTNRILSHFTMTMPFLPPHKYTIANVGSRMPHMTYKVSEIEKIHITHRDPRDRKDKFAQGLVKFVGFCMNGITRFDTREIGKMSKEKWVSRAVFLESVAAVPGMIAAMARHLNSLRRMQRDHGWVRHLLEEADNERMHLFFFLREKNPGIFFRICVWFTQFGFLLMNIIFYILSPKTMHRFVGYLEEEAVKTYNCMVDEIDDQRGALREWRHKPAPKDMAAYYCLNADTATYRDIILCIRADETGHREHNHMFSDLHGTVESEQMLPREELELIKFPLGADSEGQHDDPSHPNAPTVTVYGCGGATPMQSPLPTPTTACAPRGHQHQHASLMSVVAEAAVSGIDSITTGKSQPRPIFMTSLSITDPYYIEV